MVFVDCLYIYGFNFIIDKVLVEDVIQEIFCKLYQRDKDLIEVKNIWSYLFVVLCNYIWKSLSMDCNYEEY